MTDHASYEVRSNSNTGSMLEPPYLAMSTDQPLQSKPHGIAPEATTVQDEDIRIVP